MCTFDLVANCPTWWIMNTKKTETLMFTTTIWMRLLWTWQQTQSQCLKKEIRSTTTDLCIFMREWMPHWMLSAIELLIIIYQMRKVWSFSVSNLFRVSLVAAGSWWVRLSRPLLLFILPHRACRAGLTLHTAATVLYMSLSCQPSSPQRTTTAFISSPFTHRQ